uniref:Uncharacterized protein n=1 Tax=Arundo donax TaxID=35708 RepID=A0A0A8ZN38_ARUDO
MHRKTTKKMMCPNRRISKCLYNTPDKFITEKHVQFFLSN